VRPPQDKALLSDYVSKVFEIELEDVPFSWKGWNWGEVTVDGSAVTFKVENKPALQIPLNAISQVCCVKPLPAVMPSQR
jgi:structure-specific recognition protein 1